MSEKPKVTEWLCCDVPLISGETARFWIPRQMSEADYDLLTEYIVDYLRIGKPGLVRCAPAPLSLDREGQDGR